MLSLYANYSPNRVTPGLCDVMLDTEIGSIKGDQITTERSILIVTRN